MLQSRKAGNLSHLENHSKHPNPSKSMGNLSSNLVYRFLKYSFLKNILFLISFSVGRGGCAHECRCSWRPAVLGPPATIVSGSCEPPAMSDRECTWVFCQSSTRS